MYYFPIRSKAFLVFKIEGGKPVPKRITDEPAAIIDLEEESLHIIDIQSLTILEIAEIRNRLLEMLGGKRGCLADRGQIQ
jgi:hypothetical protein